MRSFILRPAVKGLCRAQAFIKSDAGGGGKVQRPGIGGDGNVIGGMGISLQNVFRQPFGFRSEY